MPQAIGSEYTTLSNILFWVSVILSIIVLAQVIHFVVLCVKMYQRQKKKDELRKEREQEAKDAEDAKEKGKNTTLNSVAALLLLAAGFPTHLVLFCGILLIECGVLTYSNIYFTKELKKPLEEPEPEPIPEPVSEPEPIVIPVVIPVGPTEEEEEMVAELVRETITIEEAHNAIDDDVAKHFIEVERVEEEKRYQKKTIINIDTMSEYFASGEVVNLETLKAKGLLAAKVDFFKVLARGTLDKSLTVEAQDFSADAVKMIILTGGRAVKKN